jgi:hypothetical protein
VNIFDQLNDLVFTKKRKCLDNADGESEYVPYMINRWVSMVSDTHATLINNTVNWLYPALEHKQQHYVLLHNILPRVGWKRVTYHKKVKKETTDEDVNIERLANALELSKREVKYLSQQNEQTR